MKPGLLAFRSDIVLEGVIQVIAGAEEDRRWMFRQTFHNSVEGHSVAGVLLPGVVGIRHYNLSADERSDLTRRVLRNIANEWVITDLEHPQCVQHDDCEALEALGKACFKERHP